MIEVRSFPYIFHTGTIRDWRSIVNKILATINDPRKKCRRKGIAMINSRAKGIGGEAEVKSILHHELGLNFERDLSQYREATRGDLICTDCDFPFVVEVKRWGPLKGSPDPKAWRQVCAAAEAAGKLPLLCYRYDRQTWRWKMPLEAVILAGLPGDTQMKRENYHMNIDWDYACEFDDTTTAMLIIRELLCDGTT